MHAAQQLLTKQFPNRSGLQDTLKSQNLSWELMIPGQVQLLHDGSLHWICVSTIDCPPDSIKVYDSLEFHITAYLKKQLAALIKPKSTHLTILVMKTLKQKGSSDCGVFAIAHAMLLCSSMNSLICQFDQTSIRNHLVQCFLKQKLSMFPVTSTSENSVVQQFAQLVLRNLQIACQSANWHAFCGSSVCATQSADCANSQIARNIYIINC